MYHYRLVPVEDERNGAYEIKNGDNAGQKLFVARVVTDKGKNLEGDYIGRHIVSKRVYDNLMREGSLENPSPTMLVTSKIELDENRTVHHAVALTDFTNIQKMEEVVENFKAINVGES